MCLFYHSTYVGIYYLVVFVDKKKKKWFLKYRKSIFKITEKCVSA